MGLDQYLNIVITTDKTTASRQEINNIAQKLNTLLPNYSFNNQYSPSYLDNDDMISEFDLDPIYDIDGNSTNRYELLTVKHTEYSYRKANQIQNYFETKFYNTNPDETYNCINTVLDDADVDILLNKINLIMSQPTMEDKQRYAKRLLPTVDGFFYGSTDYDQDYFDDIASFSEQLQYLNKLRNQIDHVMTDRPFSVELIYSSWW